jgi:NitT/TauT family transport system substrate-binding protein
MRFKGYIAPLAGLAMLLSACGNDSSTSSGSTELRVLMPAESPLEYPQRVAESRGFFADEGIKSTISYTGGAAEVMQQLVGGQGDIGVSCSSAIVASIEQGFDEIEVIFTQFYGSIYGLSVPEGSSIEDPAELAGKTIGISDAAGGEVPVVRGILAASGLDENDVELLPIGEGTAVALRAIQKGDVDAIGGSFSDFVGLQVQGQGLVPIGGDTLADLPACAVVTTTEFADENREVVEGFLRASARGVLWGQSNPEETLEVLREASPTGYAGELGEQMMDLYVPMMAPVDPEAIGDLSPDSYRAYFDFVGAEVPAGLPELITNEYIDAANDFDRAEVQVAER